MRAPRMARTLRDYLRHFRERSLPAQATPGDVAARGIKLLHELGGATLSLVFGDLSGQKLYAISVYPERGPRIPKGNLDLLADPRCCVGLWDDAGITYLDVSVVLEDVGQAIELGIEYNQLAIYSLAEGRVVLTGGTGDPVDTLPPEAERLPPLS